MIPSERLQTGAMRLSLALLLSAQAGQRGHADPARPVAPPPTKAKTSARKPADPADVVARRYQSQIRALLTNRPLLVRVSPLPGGKFAVRLTGRLADATQAAEVTALVQSLSADFVLNTLDLSAPSPPAPLNLEKAALALKANLDLRFMGTKAAASVLPGPAGTFLIALTGQLPANAVKTVYKDASDLARQLAPQGGLTVISQLEDEQQDPPKPADMLRVWPLMFLRGALPAQATAQSTTDIDSLGKDKAADAVADFLSNLYPKEALSVTALENHLVLKGDRAVVQKTRQMLALNLDVPSPQVRADIVVIQVNSSSTRPKSREHALEKMDEIRAGIQLVRDLMKQSRIELNAFATENSRVIDMETKNLMRQAGFDPTPSHPLSVAELLIFLGFARRDKEGKVVDLFRNALIPSSENLAGRFPNPDQENLAGKFLKMLADTQHMLSYTASTTRRNPPDPPSYPHAAPDTINGALVDWAQAPTVKAHRQNLSHLVEKIQYRIHRRGPSSPLLPRLAAQYDRRLAASDENGLLRFLKAWLACKRAFLHDHAYSDLEEQLPDALSSSSATTDLLLKQMMEAFSADLQDLLLQPLMEWIREDVQQGSAKDSGVDLVGTTSIVVRNRTLATVSGQAESYFPFTPIPKITENDLKSAQTLSQGDTSHPSVAEAVVRNPDGSVFLDANKNPVILHNGEQVVRDAAGSVVLKADKTPTILKTQPTNLPLTALGALSPLQALLLQSAFREDSAVTSYNRVAPGIDLAVRPFVLPDGGSARVQLNLTAVVETEPITTPEQYAARGRPVDKIVKQSVNTEATVNAFELTELSTFGAQTSRLGDYSWRLPLIDQIPIVGQLFHGPRLRETHRQDSIALITLSILPRSIDLVPYLDQTQQP